MTCTEKRFYADVAHHQMTIISDDDVNRNLLFRNPRSFYGHFNLITWPGHLCVSGDMGCWVFSRVRDMFCFFRMVEEDRLRAADRGVTLDINPDYWAGKLDAHDRHGDAYEFDGDAFRKEVVRRYQEWRDWRNAPPTVLRELRSDLRDLVLARADDGEHEARRAAYEFDFTGGGVRFILEDFPQCYRPSFRFIWACYAIVWGIWHYDQRNEYADFWRRAA